jgi:hypothetical protein
MQGKTNGYISTTVVLQVNLSRDLSQHIFLNVTGLARSGLARPTQK